MDKEKRIEEIAKNTGGCEYPGRPCEKCWCKEEKECSAYAYAESLYEKGYRKINDNEVVLSSEEYSNYLITQTNNAWLKEQVEKLQADNERLYKNLGKFKQSVSKETAEKIFKKLKVELKGYIGINYLEDLAKEFGVEIKEQV